MKKLLTLAVIAGTMAFYACNNDKKTEGEGENKDSVKTEETAPVTPPATDSTMKDSTKKEEPKMEEKKEGKKEEKK
ncbi:MAG: hypothetical protein NTX03_01375 [Bacteroidetes bacterium]|nr:hypothetical protein [Bacteroidota bacterium]